MHCFFPFRLSKFVFSLLLYSPSLFCWSMFPLFAFPSKQNIFPEGCWSVLRVNSVSIILCYFTYGQFWYSAMESCSPLPPLHCWFLAISYRLEFLKMFWYSPVQVALSMKKGYAVQPVWVMWKKILQNLQCLLCIVCPFMSQTGNLWGLWARVLVSISDMWLPIKSLSRPSFFVQQWLVMLK